MKNISESLAEHIYEWLSKQKYGDEELLHAAVCCDFVGMIRFKKAIAEQIDIFINGTNTKKNRKKFLAND